MAERLKPAMQPRKPGRLLFFPARLPFTPGAEPLRCDA